MIDIPDSEPSAIKLRHVGSNTNPVGTTHKFIAKLLDQNNIPMPNVSINGGIIEGVNHHSFGGTTDANGKCTFSYKGEKAGEDNIEIYWEEPPGHMGPPIAYLTKIWYIPEPTSIQLRHVGSNTNPIGTTHKFIAKLLDQNNIPMPNVSINGGIIEGVNHHSFGGTTDANGKCTFSYKGEKAGKDNIEIYWEEPPGHMGPPIAYLTKIWIDKKKRRTPTKKI